MQGNFTRKCKESEYLRERVLVLENENEELRKQLDEAHRLKVEIKRERKSKAHAKEKQAKYSSENALLQDEIKTWQQSQSVLMREIQDLRSAEQSVREENKSLRERLNASACSGHPGQVLAPDAKFPSISFAAEDS